MLNRDPMIPDLFTAVSRLDEFQKHAQNSTLQIEEQLDLLRKTFQGWNAEQRQSCRLEEIFNPAHAKIKYLSSELENDKLQKEIENYQQRLLNLKKQLNEHKTEARNSARIPNMISKLYSKAFQIELTVLSFAEDNYKCQVDFLVDRINTGKSVILHIDAEKKELIDFDGYICTKVEENEFREWYRETKNLPGLMSRMRRKLMDGCR